MSYIEEILCSRRDSAANTLVLQWQVAKAYVPKVLNTISQVFPHYSLHDQSHSEAILNCVERVLEKDNLVCLSSTDLWLLLCAAYYHDLGMVILEDDFLSAFVSKDFVDYVNSIQEDASSPLHDYACVFEQSDNSLVFKPGISLDAGTYSAARFLIADYFRSQHASRSMSSISQEKSFNIPGCDIPVRLLNLIGRICELHTSCFEEVLLLPYEEMGVGADNCHPRFVACMLRLGDLLDLDNNRFSDVLLATLPSIPADSLLHKEKHLSMTHILINHDLVELSSVCSDMDVYDIMNRWLKMLSDEMNAQRGHWNAITPCENKLYLPCVGTIDVALNNWDTINGKELPKFKIDSEKAIEMLQGTGLYNSPHQCIREILQNSVDATYLRIFSESVDLFKPILSYEEFKEVCKSKKIRVTLDKTDIDAENVQWLVTIRDEGIGMSKDDLGYLLRTGSKNPEKARMISKMPEFMKPSGTFGIGFQSLFLMTDMVNLKTHRVGKEETLLAELYNPSKGKHGTALVKTTKDPSPFGTEVSFSFVTRKIINSYSINSNETEAAVAIYGHDFLLNESMDIDAARIVHEVRRFASESLVGIEMDMCAQKVILKDGDKESIFDTMSDDGCYEVSVHGKSENLRDVVFYRGQLVEKGSTNLHYLNAFVNILSGNAKHIVTLNRNALQSEYKTEFRKQMIGVFTDYVIKKYNSLKERTKSEASMFLLYYDKENRHNHPDGAEEDWKRYVNCDYGKESDSIETILSISDGKSISLRFDSTPYSLTCINNEVVVNYPYDDVEYVLFDYLKKSYRNCGLKWIDGHQYVHFSNEQCELVSDIRKWLKAYSRSRSMARTLMPCLNKYNALRLREDMCIPWAYDDISSFKFSVPYMICPYVKDVEPGFFCTNVGLRWDDGDGKLAQMTYDNRFDKSTTMDEIIEAIRSFKKDTEDVAREIDEKLKELNDENKSS